MKEFLQSLKSIDMLSYIKLMQGVSLESVIPEIEKNLKLAPYMYMGDKEIVSNYLQKFKRRTNKTLNIK